LLDYCCNCYLLSLTRYSRVSGYADAVNASVPVQIVFEIDVRLNFMSFTVIHLMNDCDAMPVPLTDRH